MPITAHLSLVSPERSALLDVVDGAEAAFFEHGLSPDISGVQTLGTDLSSTKDGHPTADGTFPDHFSSEFVAEISELDGGKLHYVAMRGLPVVGRVVREEAPGRPSVVIQSNKHTGSGPGCKVYRYDKRTGDYEILSDGDSRLGH